MNKYSSMRILVVGAVIGGIAGAAAVEALRGTAALAQIGTPKTERVTNLAVAVVPELKPKSKDKPDEKIITGFAVQYFRVLGDGQMETRSDKAGDRWRPFE